MAYSAAAARFARARLFSFAVPSRADLDMRGSAISLVTLARVDLADALRTFALGIISTMTCPQLLRSSIVNSLEVNCLGWTQGAGRSPAQGRSPSGPNVTQWFGTGAGAGVADGNCTLGTWRDSGEASKLGLRAKPAMPATMLLGKVETYTL